MLSSVSVCRLSASIHRALSLVITIVALTAASASAQLDQKPSTTPSEIKHFGTMRVDMQTGTQSWVSDGATLSDDVAPKVATDVYANTSTALGTVVGPSGGLFDVFGTVYGDRITTTDIGILSEVTFSVYNAPGNSNLFGATFEICFYDASDWPTFPNGYPATILACFDTPNLDFGAGVPPGAAIIIDLFNIDGLGLDINKQDVLMTHMWTGFQGSILEAGAPLFDPPTIGSSDDALFQDNPSAPGGGYGPVAGGVANLGYRINVIPCDPTITVSTVGVINTTLGNPAGDSFDIFTDDCRLNWQIVEDPDGSGDCPWLTLNQASGVLPPNGSTQIDITVDPFGLAPGAYSCELEIQSNDPISPAVRRFVFMQVNGAVNDATVGECFATQGYAGTMEWVSIDPTTGAGTVVGNTRVPGISGLAIDSTGRVFGAGATARFDDNMLYRIDVSTGAVVAIGDTGLGCLQAMAFNASDDLYAIGTCSQPFASLYTVDTDTGIPTLIALVSPFVGLSFDPTSGVLYAVQWSQGLGIDNLYTVNTVTGASSFIGSFGLGIGIGDIYFDSAGNLFGVIGGGAGPNSFVSINKTTGAATVIGPTGIGALTGLDCFRGAPTAVPQIDTRIPTGYRLHEASPNPFNPVTLIRFDMPRASHVRLDVYDVLGRRVQSVLDGQKSAGTHAVRFRGEDLASGIYFYVLRTNGYRESRKMTLVK